MPSIYPQKEAQLVPWGLNLKTRLIASPTTFFVTAPLADELGDNYDEFLLKWNICQVPTTRTRPALELKNVAKRIFTQNVTSIAALINGNPGMNNALRLELGFPEHESTFGSINPPTEQPVIIITKVENRLVSMKLRQEDSERRGKPAQVQCAEIYSYIGSAPPADVRDWTSEGSSTKTALTVAMPPTVPGGSQVFFCAVWKNPRQQSGPMSAIVSCYLGGGVSSAVA